MCEEMEWEEGRAAAVVVETGGMGRVGRMTNEAEGRDTVEPLAAIVAAVAAAAAAAAAAPCCRLAAATRSAMVLVGPRVPA
jgi:hypothetical protein